MSKKAQKSKAIKTDIKKTKDGAVAVVKESDINKGAINKIASLPNVKVIYRSLSREYQDPFEASFFTNLTKDYIASQDEHDAMKLAAKYAYDPVVSKMLKLLVEFALVDFENIHPDKKIRSFYDKWCDDVRIDEVIEDIYHDFFIYGNVYIIPTLVPYRSRTGKISGAGKIPGAYTLLNPQYIYIDYKNGEKIFKYKITSKIRKRLQKDPNIPDYIKKQIKGSFREIELKDVEAIYYHKSHYQSYASPPLKGLFKSLHFKNMLRELDLTLIEAGKHKIYLIKMGDKDHIPTDDTINEMIQQFKTPSPDLTVFADWTVEIEVIQPKLDILGVTKYEETNKDILAEINAPPRIIRQPGERAKELREGIDGFRQTILYAHRKVKRWLRGEYKKIADALGFGSYPEIFFPEPLVTSPYDRIEALWKLKDRALLSCETAYNEVKRILHLPYDFETEKKKILYEQELVKQGLMPIPMSPYQQSPGRPKEPEDKKSNYPEERKQIEQ